MSYYKIVPKSDYSKMKDCHTAAYNFINKALEQDEDRESKVSHGAKWHLPYHLMSRRR